MQRYCLKVDVDEPINGSGGEVWGAETPICLYCRCEQVVHLEDPELSTYTTQILPGIDGIHCPTCGLCW